MSKSRTAFIVLDHFYKDIEEMQKESLTLSYHHYENNPSSLVSKKSKFTLPLKRKISKYVTGDTKWDSYSGTYRKTNQKLVESNSNSFQAHSDGEINFVSLLYVSPQEACHGGTAFYRHKRTGLEGFADMDRVDEVMTKHKISFEDLNEELRYDSKSISKWEVTSKVEMRQNRLLIFNGREFHSHYFEFDKVKKNSQRLTFLIFGATNYF